MASKLGPRLNDAVLGLVTLEHRVDPYFEVIPERSGHPVFRMDMEAAGKVD